MTASKKLPDRYRCLEVLRDDSAEFLARAEDTVLKREVLVKAPGPGMRRHLLDVHDGDRALREARALAKLSHPNVVKLLDVVEHDGAPILVLQPIAGETLSDRVARAGKLSALETARLGKSLASALSAIHAGGAVHRGIAPENVILGVDEVPVLVGFGFAKFASKTGASSIHYQTANETVDPEFSIPLPRFPAPEQILGSAADARCDVYGLGCTLEFALTGKEPEPQRAHDPARKRDPSPLSTVLERSTMRSPLQRYQTAAQLEAALAEIVVAEEAVAKSGISPSAGKARRMRPAHWSALAAVVIAGAALPFVFSSRPPNPSGAALDDRERGPKRTDAVLDSASIVPLAYQNSWALLIGISEYEDPGFADLPNAERDIAALKSKLDAMTWEKWNIRTLLGKDATKQRIRTELARLADHTRDRKGDRVLIYYAGHGERDPERAEAGWIVPVDAKPASNAVGRVDWLDYREVNVLLAGIDATHVLLMLDCCFGGVAASLRGASDDIRSNLAAPARMVLSSGNEHQRVSDGADGHSPFLRAFLQALEDDRECMPVTLLYNRIKDEMPVGGSSARLGEFAPGVGDFMFFPKPRAR